MMRSFETERLRLRPLRPDDLDLMVELDSDPEVMRYINGGRPTPRDDVAGIIARTRGHRWLAFALASGEFAGRFSLRPAGRPGDRELGYRLPRRAWGHGFATEGCLALIDLAFTDLGSDRVWAQTMTVNTRSRRVMERCGLRYVRTFHGAWPEAIEGTEQGDVEYELLRPDWRAGQT